MTDSELATSDRHGTRRWVKPVLFVVVAAVAVLLFLQFGEALKLKSLAARESELRQFQAQYPWLVYGLAFCAYVVAAALLPGGATGMTVVFGWYFGILRGLVLVSFASTAGATVAFLLSRYLFRESIQNRFGDRLASFNESLEREGAFYLFTLRLIVAVPFFVINVVMGLTPIRTRTYWWVSQLGMLPGTAVYVYAGSSVPDLETLAAKGAGGILSIQLMMAFLLLGAFPLAVKRIMARFRPDRSNPELETTDV